MPIFNATGDLFKNPATFKVVTINCVGAMGKGVALGCRSAFPDLYARYKENCRQGFYKPGGCYVDGPVILIATKMNWRNPSKFLWVSECLLNLQQFLITQPEGTTVAMTLPGAGNGGLDPETVERVVHDVLGGLEHITIHIYG